MNSLIADAYRKAMSAAHLGLPVGDSEEFSQSPTVKAVDVVGGYMSPVSQPISQAIKKGVTGEGWKESMSRPPIENAESMAMGGMVYHGTPNIKGLIRGIRKGQVNSGDYGPGLYTTNKKAIAEAYAKGVEGEKVKGSSIIPIDESGMRIKNFTSDEYLQTLKQLKNELYQEYLKSGEKGKPLHDVLIDKLKKESYEGMNIPDDKQAITLIFDPKKALDSRVKKTGATR